MPNKHRNLDQIKKKNRIPQDPNYCSFCAAFMNKMKDHSKAHELRYHNKLAEAFEYY